MTVQQILKKLKAANKTLIPTTRIETYLTEYMTNPTAIDAYYMGIKYKDLHVVSDDLQDIESIVDVAFLVNDSKWAKLYATLNLEYNPLWNVDATIVETHDIDNRHSEDNFGQRENTYTYGQVSDNTTNKTTPYDDANFRNLSKQERETLQHEDEHVISSHIDQHDEDAYLDTISTTRTGNIGVTSSQELIEKERAISDFKFLDILMRDIINMITEPYFEEV